MRNADLEGTQPPQLQSQSQPRELGRPRVHQTRTDARPAAMDSMRQSFEEFLSSLTASLATHTRATQLVIDKAEDHKDDREHSGALPKAVMRALGG